MELGALVCSRKPGCGVCPIADRCESLRLGIPTERPVPRQAAKCVELDVASGLLTHAGRVFVQKRPEGGVWPGLWELPGGRVEPGESPAQAVVREFDEELCFRVRVREDLGVIRHGYTKYRVALHCFALGLESEPTPALRAATDFRWASPGELAGFAFPAGHRKLLDQLLRDGRLQGLARV